MDPDLTLDKAKRMVRQHEAVQEQQEILKSGQMGQKVVVEYVKHTEPKPNRAGHKAKSQGSKQ